MQLVRYGQEVKTIFDLFGSKENDMTFSLGWVLSRSEGFLRLLIANVCGFASDKADKAIIKLQTGRGVDGITDIEIEIGKELVIIVEAKKGPQVPTAHQLAKYGKFLSRTPAKRRHILALTNASADRPERIWNVKRLINLACTIAHGGRYVCWLKRRRGRPSRIRTSNCCGHSVNTSEDYLRWK